MAPHFRNCQYYGVDGSREMLRIGESRISPDSLTLCDFSSERLPFEDGFFDFALCMQVLRHMNVAHQPHILSELARVVNGAVFIHDIFYEGDRHIYDAGELGGQLFINNTWALSVFLADVAKCFPGREIRQRGFIGPSFGLEILRS